MAREFSELFVQTRPVSDVRVRREAYRIFYTVSKSLLPGEILLLRPEVWLAKAEPLCDPARLEGAHECAALRAFLVAMPELVRQGGIPIDWSRMKNGAQKYDVDEWGMVTRFHNPKTSTQDPAVPKKYRSPVRLVEDEPRFRPEGSRAELKQELTETTQYKQIRHAAVLSIKNSSRDENGPQDIHLRRQGKVVEVFQAGTVVKPVTMLAFPGGASVDTYDWGEIVADIGDGYLVRFAEHSRIDLETLDTVRGAEMTGHVTYEEVVPV
jgi:hypothetical protein